MFEKSDTDPDAVLIASYDFLLEHLHWLDSERLEQLEFLVDETRKYEYLEWIGYRFRPRELDLSARHKSFQDAAIKEYSISDFEVCAIQRVADYFQAQIDSGFTAKFASVRTLYSPAFKVAWSIYTNPDRSGEIRTFRHRSAP